MTETSTRQRLIEAAHQLFYRQGFQGVGLDGILAEVGVTKTTFYKYFDGKDDLIVEVLRHHDVWWQQTLPALLLEHAGDDPAEQLRAILDVLEALTERDDFRGCIFQNVAVEFPLPTDPAHRVAAEAKRAQARLLAGIARRAGVSAPDAFAEELGLLMEGLFALRSVDRSAAAGHAARRTAALLYAKYLPEAAARPA